MVTGMDTDTNMYVGTRPKSSSLALLVPQATLKGLPKALVLLN